MTLAQKFLAVVLSSILFVAMMNVFGFYIFYGSFFKIYLAERISTQKTITLEYVDNIRAKQTIDDIDSIFSDIEIEFFELLENNQWEIPTENKENRDVVINYLVKAGIAPKYIEEIIPTDNFSKVLENIGNTSSPESKFLNRIIIAMIITNVLSIAIAALSIFIFTQKTIKPITQVTKKIKAIDPRKSNVLIEYPARDEVGLLINSINDLNKRLSLQEWIRNRLLADISHELKTPITSIQCYLEWIWDGVIELNEKNLDSIIDEMKRLTSLVNRIMKFEKFENQKLELDTNMQDIWEITKQVVETHKKTLKENKQRVKITGIDDFEVTLDKNLFKQVVHNLIGNFQKYAGKHSQLTINITKRYIDFKDNGKWISKSEVQFLTEKFYQGNIEKSGDAETRGMWVGLSLVDKIVDTHGWRIKIDSDVGKWFSFKIYF